MPRQQTLSLSWLMVNAKRRPHAHAVMAEQHTDGRTRRTAADDSFYCVAGSMRRGPARSTALKAVLLAAVALAAALPAGAAAATGAVDAALSDAGGAAETPQDAGGGAAAALAGDGAVIPEAGDSMATLKTADTTYQVLTQVRLDLDDSVCRMVSYRSPLRLNAMRVGCWSGAAGCGRSIFVNAVLIQGCCI